MNIMIPDELFRYVSMFYFYHIHFLLQNLTSENNLCDEERKLVST